MLPKPIDLHIRLSAELVAKLREAARANERSMSAEIRSRLRASFDSYRV